MSDYYTKEFVRANRRSRNWYAWGVERKHFPSPLEVVLRAADKKQKLELLAREIELVGIRDELRRNKERRRGKLYRAGSIAGAVLSTLALGSLWER